LPSFGAPDPATNTLRIKRGSLAVASWLVVADEGREIATTVLVFYWLSRTSLIILTAMS
jgi:hypothetical protein